MSDTLTFDAKYAGVCSNCEDRFSEGDPIGYDADDEIRCKPCLTGVSPVYTAKRPTPRCTECNLVHAGECW